MPVQSTGGKYRLKCQTSFKIYTSEHNVIKNFHLMVLGNLMMPGALTDPSGRIRVDPKCVKVFWK